MCSDALFEQLVRYINDTAWCFDDVIRWVIDNLRLSGTAILAASCVSVIHTEGRG